MKKTPENRRAWGAAGLRHGKSFSVQAAPPDWEADLGRDYASLRVRIGREISGATITSGNGFTTHHLNGSNSNYFVEY